MGPTRCARRRASSSATTWTRSRSWPRAAPCPPPTSSTRRSTRWRRCGPRGGSARRREVRARSRLLGLGHPRGHPSGCALHRARQPAQRGGGARDQGGGRLSRADHGHLRGDLARGQELRRGRAPAPEDQHGPRALRGGASAGLSRRLQDRLGFRSPRRHAGPPRRRARAEGPGDEAHGGAALRHPRQRRDLPHGGSHRLRGARQVRGPHRGERQSPRGPPRLPEPGQPALDHEGRSRVQADVVTAAVALLLAILIWASNSVMVKIVLREISPLALTWLRFLFAALFYVPFAIATWTRAPGYSRREWPLLLGAGVALVPVFSLTLYWALTYTSVANTALVRMTEPAWVLLLGAAFLGEHPTRRQLAGLVLALAGTAALVLVGRQPSVSGNDHA